MKLTKWLGTLGLICIGAVETGRTDFTRGFECYNEMYRSAKLEFGLGLLIEDSIALEKSTLESLFEKKLGLSKNRILVMSAGLFIAQSDLNCIRSVNYELDCTAQFRSGSLLVSAYLKVENELGGQLRLSQNVQVENFSLKTRVTGNRVLNNDRLVVDARAEIIIDGEKMTFGWDPFFYTSDNHEYSGCRTRR